ncbi:unnamed protein product [Rotaria magnacalcarata]|uniref:KICSTOR complex protein kaptin-like n=1 Tax=Rotaria magnacalcarata TaxID=392030 RepID=A0A816K095_9BILA|nr:unnamed protein product [Rotaria magnacalcarata]CAF3902149.1 unnamed protein product [Rotaria magnacalcarata]
MFSLKEIFFQPLKCQPNINTLHVHRNLTTKYPQIFLVGLDGLGVVVEYVQAANEFKAYTISLQDPAFDCRVLSMELLPISKYNTSPAIVYGYAKTNSISNNDDCSSYYFDRVQILDNNTKSSTQNRLGFAAKYMKTIITKNVMTNENEVLLVVAGADKLAFFSEKNERTLQDVTKIIDLYLPELKQAPGNVCAMDLLLICDPKTDQLKQRLIVCGYSTGLLDLYITDVQPDGSIKTTEKTLEYDSFISTVKFFYHNQKPLENEKPHLIVTSALEPAVIYRNVSMNGLTDPVVLYGTDSQDCITSSCVCDIDLDGKNEILLGTFGKTCFICRIPIENYKCNKYDGLTFIAETFPVCRVLSLAASAFGILALDLTNDGLDEIVIATTKGLHIYQLELSEVVKLIESRLEKKSNENDNLSVTSH